MSIECLNQAIKTEGLTPTKKLILIILANYADEKGTCYPSYSHIAKIVGLSDTKNIKRIISELEQRGLLRIQNRKKENGGFTSNLYHMTMGRGVETHRSTIEDTKGAETPRERVLTPPNTKDDTKTNTYSESFEQFWKEYPRKLGKHQASVSFGKYDDKHYKKIIYAAKVFAQENLTTEERFIPHATTWLNQQRYLDYLDKTLKNKNLNNLAG
tara:strand:+ start:583 stop:1221 length:639 start_codon:yes stop_codon:yes gene_type:complete